jgi:WD40 repeat protein
LKGGAAKFLLKRSGPGLAIAVPVAQAVPFLWSPDGKELLAGVACSTLTVGETGISHEPAGWFLERWERDTGRRQALDPKLAHFPLAFHPDGRRYVAVGTAQEAGVQIRDAATWDRIRTLSREWSNPCAAAWSHDGKSLLFVDGEGKASVYEPEEGREVRSWAATEKEWSAFTLSADGRWVVTGGEDSLLRVRDVRTGKDLARWQAHEAPITALTFSPDGALLVSGARDGTVRVWNLPWIRAELAKLGLDW